MYFDCYIQQMPVNMSRIVFMRVCVSVCVFVWVEKSFTMLSGAFAIKSDHRDALIMRYCFIITFHLRLKASLCICLRLSPSFGHIVCWILFTQCSQWWISSTVPVAVTQSVCVKVKWIDMWLGWAEKSAEQTVVNRPWIVLEGIAV